MTHTAPNTTQFLLDWSGGDPNALERVLPLIYDELHAAAGRLLAGERRDHTLQPTALVNEAYLRLVDQTRADLQCRTRFIAAAVTAMRRILVDHARKKHSVKRGGECIRIPFDETIDSSGGLNNVDLLALDEALGELDRLNPRHRQTIELRFFGGLSVDECAQVLDVSPQTVRLDWYMARAWLKDRLER